MPKRYLKDMQDVIEKKYDFGLILNSYRIENNPIIEHSKEILLYFVDLSIQYSPLQGASNNFGIYRKEHFDNFQNELALKGFSIKVISDFDEVLVLSQGSTIITEALEGYYEQSLLCSLQESKNIHFIYDANYILSRESLF